MNTTKAAPYPNEWPNFEYQNENYLKTIISLERKLFELPVLVAVGSPSCKITITVSHRL